MPRQFSALSRLLALSLVFRSFTIFYLFSMLNNICNNHVTHSADVPHLLYILQNNCFSVICYVIHRFFCCHKIYVSFYKETDSSLYCFVFRFGWFLFLNANRGYLHSKTWCTSESLSRGSLWRGKRCHSSGFHCCGPAEYQSPASVSYADIFVRFKPVVLVTIVSGKCISPRRSS